METPTHADILDRIDDLEAKVDRLCALAEQANGAWTLMKVMGTFALGIAAFWTYVQGWLGQGR